MEWQWWAPTLDFNYFLRFGKVITVQHELLIMRNISKTFTEVKALDKVDFTLRAGEVHALLGENGAGKSTLIKVLTGAEKFESGEILMEGRSIINGSPREAQMNGISTVYQEVNLCPNLTVAENIFVGRHPMRHGSVAWAKMNAHAKEILDRLNINIDPTKPLSEYSIAIQQMVAIARAVDISAKVLILDEPTSSLDEDEVEKLFDTVNRLKAEGVGVIFVTHFLDQVYRICDRITVLRNGSLVGEYDVDKLPKVELVAKMLGKDFDDLAEIEKERAAVGKQENKELFIKAKGLGCTGTVKPFDMDIYKGEVVGLSGLLGSGRSELVRCIYSVDRPDSGKLFVKGKETKFRTPIDAMRAGLAYLSEDRKEEGIFADLSVRENIIIALQAKLGIGKTISRKEQEAFAEEYIKMLQIKVPNPDTPIKNLSGGNQQKVIIGRWLLTHPELLILDEPTRGIDVGTKTEIQKIVLKLAGDGVGVVFISSEIDEMVRVVSRMGIMRDGQKTGELNEDEISQSNIMRAVAGGMKSE